MWAVDDFMRLLLGQWPLSFGDRGDLASTVRNENWHKYDQCLVSWHRSHQRAHTTLKVTIAKVLIQILLHVPFIDAKCKKLNRYTKAH